MLVTFVLFDSIDSLFTRILHSANFIMIAMNVRSGGSANVAHQTLLESRSSESGTANHRDRQPVDEQIRLGVASTSAG